MVKLFYKNGIQFQCQGSSNCCVSRGSYGYVYLSEKDINRLSKFMKLSTGNFIKLYCDMTDGYNHLKEINKNGECQFLINKKCTVYKARPNQCRTWPFWKENMNAKKWNNEIKKFCPGVGKGKTYDVKTIDKFINEDQKNDKNVLKKTNFQLK